MDLNEKERLILYNQYEILKLLNEDKYEKRQCEINQKILVQGFKNQYQELINGFEEEVSETVSQFVWDVLNLHRRLLFSYHALSDEEKHKIDVRSIKYNGFDGNEEGEYYSFANFILKDLRLFEEIYDEGKAELNSHSNMLDTYEAMVDEWKATGKKSYDNLNAEEIKKIMTAGYR